MLVINCAVVCRAVVGLHARLVPDEDAVYTIPPAYVSSVPARVVVVAAAGNDDGDTEAVVPS